MPDLDLHIPDCRDLAELRRTLNTRLDRIAEALRKPLDIPEPSLPGWVLDALRDLRAGSVAGSQSSTVATPRGNSANPQTPAAAAAGVRAIALSVPGTLSVRSSAAPLVTLAEKAQPVALVALVKQAPLNQDIKVQVWAGTAKWAAVTIPAGARSAKVTAGLAAIEADTEITVDLVQVGSVFPGADLTVLIRLAGQ